ncbi:hypothetical protein MXM33_09335 [Acinetobacter vivianii]|uniref:hypothetical protein n=1 Tax=Acinetobacter vivianii TaxID=1776742 RepID=UPI002DBDB4B2|nr:hypothetical protein [Acinetobacter vivianii]MEB6667232.1 hypothetical protein [Acinetobacter vivianii]
MHTLVVKLDALLQRSDSDSMDWADGGGAEKAEEMLAALPEPAWPELKALCSSRNAAWRACLVSILCPQHGELAKYLMLELAADQDVEVAFLAVSSIAFYCGVNDSTKETFVDLSIQDASFLSQAKAKLGLTSHIHRVRASSHTLFQKRFEALAQMLESDT